MKRYFILLLIIISPLFWRGFGGEAFAQQHKIDSLTKLLKPGVEDTNQARIYLKLANAYSTNNYDKGIEELTIAYTMNKKLNNYRGLMNCANMYGIINARKGNYKDALIYFNESIDLSKKYFPKKLVGSP